MYLVGSTQSSKKYVPIKDSVKLPTSDKAEQTYQGMFSGHVEYWVFQRSCKCDFGTLGHQTRASAPSAYRRWHLGHQPQCGLGSAGVRPNGRIRIGTPACQVTLQHSRRVLTDIVYPRRDIGYLCRSIVSWTTSSIQVTSGLDVLTRVEETDTIVSTLYRRGARAVPLLGLRDLVVARACLDKADDEHGHSRIVTVDVTALMAPYAMGGIDHGYPGDLAVFMRKQMNIPRLGTVVQNRKRIGTYSTTWAPIRPKGIERLCASRTNQRVLRDIYRGQNSSGCGFPSELESSTAEYIEALTIWSRKVATINAMSYVAKRTLWIKVCAA